MIIPCDKKVTCECSELPLTNYSSEDPDLFLFLGRAYHNGQSPSRLEGTTTITDCGASFSSSWLSQIEADDCARRQQIKCENNEFSIEDPCEACGGFSNKKTTWSWVWSRTDLELQVDVKSEGKCCDQKNVFDAVEALGQEEAKIALQNSLLGCCCESTSVETDPRFGTGGDTPPDAPGVKLYPNMEKCYTAKCPDGTENKYCVKPGTFMADSQIQADEQAAYRAKQMAERTLMCWGDSPNTGCCNVQFNQAVYLTYGPEVARPITLGWSGNDIPGITIQGHDSTPGDPGYWVSFLGTPTQPGNYEIQLTATAKNKQEATKSIFIKVLGISSGHMDSNGILVQQEGVVDENYSSQLLADGGDQPYTFTYDTFNAPSWLTVNSSGFIASTTPPTNISQNAFSVTVRDKNGVQCSQMISVPIHGPKFLNAPTNGTVCIPYSFQFLADPPGTTFAGTTPAGLVITSGGLATGTPTSEGLYSPNRFNITATDPSGNQHQKIFNITIAPVGDGYPRAIADMVWVDSGGGGYGGGTSGGSIVMGVGSGTIQGVSTGFPSGGIIDLRSVIACCFFPTNYAVRIVGAWGPTSGSPSNGSAKIEFQGVLVCNFAGAAAITNSIDVTIPAGAWPQFPGAGLTQVFFDIFRSVAGGFQWRFDLTITPIYPP